MNIQRTTYAPLPACDEDNDKEDDTKSERLSSAGEVIATRKLAPHRRPWLVHLTIFSLYTIAFLAIFVFSFGHSQKWRKKPWLLEQSIYSPALEAVEYSMVQFDGSLDLPSSYKGFGHRTQALDDAWDRITTNQSFLPIRLSDEDLKKINKAGRPSNVRYKEADGGGSMGALEIFHQLHCLDMLRKYTYPDEYSEVHEQWQKRPKLLRSHLDHCIDIIRQRLMCVADVGVISYDWRTGWDVPIPDLNTYHRCRNFDAILDWVTDNRVHIPQDHMSRIGDEIDLPEWHTPD